MARCTERVSHAGMFRSLPCSRKAVTDKDLGTLQFTKCKQHSDAAVHARRQKSCERSGAEFRLVQARHARATARNSLVDKVAQLLKESVQPGGGVMISSKWRQELHDLVERAK